MSAATPLADCWYCMAKPSASCPDWCRASEIGRRRGVHLMADWREQVADTACEALFVAWRAVRRADGSGRLLGIALRQVLADRADMGAARA